MHADGAFEAALAEAAQIDAAELRDLLRLHSLPDSVVSAAFRNGLDGCALLQLAPADLEAAGATEEHTRAQLQRLRQRFLSDPAGFRQHVPAPHSRRAARRLDELYESLGATDKVGQGALIVSSYHDKPELLERAMRGKYPTADLSFLADFVAAQKRVVARDAACAAALDAHVRSRGGHAEGPSGAALVRSYSDAPALLVRLIEQRYPPELPSELDFLRRWAAAAADPDSATDPAAGDCGGTAAAARSQQLLAAVTDELRHTRFRARELEDTVRDLRMEVDAAAARDSELELLRSENARLRGAAAEAEGLRAALRARDAECAALRERLDRALDAVLQAAAFHRPEPACPVPSPGELPPPPAAVAAAARAAQGQGRRGAKRTPRRRSVPGRASTDRDPSAPGGTAARPVWAPSR